MYFLYQGTLCPPQYIADMLRDLADEIMTSYPEVKDKSSNG